MFVQIDNQLLKHTFVCWYCKHALNISFIWDSWKKKNDRYPRTTKVRCFLTDLEHSHWYCLDISTHSVNQTGCLIRRATFRSKLTLTAQCVHPHLYWRPRPLWLPCRRPSPPNSLHVSCNQSATQTTKSILSSSIPWKLMRSPTLSHQFFRTSIRINAEKMSSRTL